MLLFCLLSGLKLIAFLLYASYTFVSLHAYKWKFLLLLASCRAWTGLDHYNSFECLISSLLVDNNLGAAGAPVDYSSIPFWQSKVHIRRLLVWAVPCQLLLSSMKVHSQQ